MQAGLRLLGPVEVLGPDGALRAVGPKERCLLTVLGVHAGRVVAEDRLVEALWDGHPPRSATKTLQNYVLRLRRVLAAGGAGRIVTRPPGYLLDATASDAAIAESLIADGRRALERGPHGAALDALDRALALWRGPSLHEFADREFARGEAARLEELRASATEDRIAATLALGRHHEAVAALEVLVGEQPLRERRWTQLMLALYRDGRQAEALEAYRRLRATLAAQLGVDPGPEARRLEAAVLAHDEALLAVPAPTRRVGPARCFGRDRELAALLRRVKAAEEGDGGVALVRGEPGIGKTRLLAELAAVAAGRGATVLSGRCPEGGALPFHPFAEALRPRLDGPDAPSGELGEGLALLAPRWSPPGNRATLRPDERRARLLDAVARFLAQLAAAAPTVLLLDDLHWADEGAAAVLRHVARTTGGRRLLLVGAYRGGDVRPTHPLAEVLGALRTEADCSTVALGGIDRPAVEQLLWSTAGAPLAADVVDAISRETDGNPFFAREVVRHLQEDGALRPGPDGRLRTALPLIAVPDGVRDVIARRRRRLSADADALLDAAAGVEGPFPFEPVRTVAGLADGPALAALDEVLAAELVVPDAAPDRYEFVHALVRHAVHAELNPSRRLRLHRDLGEALASDRARGGRISAAEVAVQHHRAAALAPSAAGAGSALEAAEQAAAAGAHDEQARFLRMARDLLPADDGRRATTTARLAVALAWALRFDDAVTAAREAAAEAPPGPGAALVAEVATVLATAGSNRHAWELVPIGLAAPGDADPVTLASLVLLDLDRREAADPQHPGIPLDLPGRREALRVLHEAGRLAGRGDLARYAVAAVHGRRDRVPLGAADDPTVAAFLLGDCATAAPRFAADADAALERGRLAWAVYCRAGAARCRIALGDLAAGRVELARSRELVTRVPALQLGWQLLHHQGAEDALVSVLDEGWDERRAAFAPWVAPAPERQWGSAAIDSIAARIEARRGNAAAALALLARPVRALHQAPAWAPNHGRMACESAEVLWLLDRRDHLAVIESALREKALPADFRFPMTDVRLALARLCALDGRREDARRWFDAARVVLDGQGALPLRAVVDHDEALMHHRAGDSAAARPVAARAAAAFARVGMPGWLQRLDAERLPLPTPERGRRDGGS